MARKSIAARTLSAAMTAVLFIVVPLPVSSAATDPAVHHAPRPDTSPSPPPGAPGRSSIDGTIRLLAADTVEGTTADHTFRGPSTDHYQLVLVTGDRSYFLKGNGGSEPGKGARPNTRVRVVGIVSGDTIQADAIEELGDAPPTVSPSGTTRVLVMLAHWNVPNSVTQERARTQMFTDTNGWFRDASYTALGQSGDVTPWMRIAGPDGGKCYADHMNIMQQAKNAATALGYHIVDYDNFVLYFPNNSWQAGSDCNGAAGWAYVGWEGTWLNGYMDRRVTVHEQGHNYGLRHAHSYMCADGLTAPCSWSDYGDSYDAMGSSGFVAHFSGAHKSSLGWMTGRTVDLSGGGSAALAPVANDAPATVAAVVQVSPSRSYWLEYRQPVDYDRSLPSYATDGVQVRVVDSSIGGGFGPNLLDVRPSDGADVTTATLRSGSAWTTPEGFGSVCPR